MAPFAKKARRLGDSASETPPRKKCGGDGGALFGHDDPEASEHGPGQHEDVDNDPMRLFADATTPPESQTTPSKEEEEFLSVVGQEVPLVTVCALLRAAGGNLERAINGYYDCGMRELTNDAGRGASPELKKSKPNQSASLPAAKKTGKGPSTKSGTVHRRATQGAAAPQQRQLTALWGRLKSPDREDADATESKLESSLTHDKIINEDRLLVEQSPNEEPNLAGDYSSHVHTTQSVSDQRDSFDFTPSPVMGLVEEATPGLGQLTPTPTPSTAAKPIDKKEEGILCRLDRSPESFDPIKHAGWNAGEWNRLYNKKSGVGVHWCTNL